jgi:starch phosphorylase
MEILEKEALPIYYKDKKKWMSIMRNSMIDTLNDFDSGRMVHEYYTKMYNI